MKYSHVVFDLDGTIVDNEYVILQSLQEALKEITGIEHPKADLKFSLGVPATVPLRHFGIGDVEGAHAIWIKNMAKYADHAKPFPDVVRALRLFRDNGLELGIVTSRTRAEYDDEFLPYGLGDLFGVSICTNDTKLHKPNPDPLLEYLKRVGCPKENAIYVGDSKYDMQCAASAGVDGGHAMWGGAPGKHPEAKFYFATPEEMVALVMG